jgi:hypothetical protein
MRSRCGLLAPPQPLGVGSASEHRAPGHRRTPEPAEALCNLPAPPRAGADWGSFVEMIRNIRDSSAGRSEAQAGSIGSQSSAFGKADMVLLPLGDILPTGVMVRYAARWHEHPRLIQGRQREFLPTRLVAFLAAASRGAAAIMIVYRLHGER